MSVFLNKREIIITNNLSKLFERAIMHMPPPDVSPTDIYEMIVKPADIPRLRQIERDIGEFALSGLSDSRTSLAIRMPLPNAATPYVSFTTKQPITGLLPAYATDGPHNEAAIPAPIINWLERRYTLGVKFARAERVFTRLNYLLKTPAQMKMYFNGIVALLEMDDITKKTAAKLREAAMPSSFPSIDPVLRAGGIEATQTIAQALLFPNEPPDDDTEVKMALGKHQCGTVQFLGRSISVW